MRFDDLLSILGNEIYEDMRDYVISNPNASSEWMQQISREEGGIPFTWEDWVLREMRFKYLLSQNVEETPRQKVIRLKSYDIKRRQEAILFAKERASISARRAKSPKYQAWLASKNSTSK